jgi:uncharacterized membrane protein
MTPVDLAPDARAGNRALMHILYALHTLTWLSAGLLTLVALVINYIRRTDDPSALFRAHHAYMIRSYCLCLLGLLLSAPLFFLFFFPGMLAWSGLSLWYLYRCIRGWMRFTDHLYPHTLGID